MSVDPPLESVWGYDSAELNKVHALATRMSEFADALVQSSKTGAAIDYRFLYNSRFKPAGTFDIPRRNGTRVSHYNGSGPECKWQNGVFAARNVCGILRCVHPHSMTLQELLDKLLLLVQFHNQWADEHPRHADLLRCIRRAARRRYRSIFNEYGVCEDSGDPWCLVTELESGEDAIKFFLCRARFRTQPVLDDNGVVVGWVRPTPAPGKRGLLWKQSRERPIEQQSADADSSQLQVKLHGVCEAIGAAIISREADDKNTLPLRMALMLFRSTHRDALLNWRLLARGDVAKITEGLKRMRRDAYLEVYDSFKKSRTSLSTVLDQFEHLRWSWITKTGHTCAKYRSPLGLGYIGLFGAETADGWAARLSNPLAQTRRIDDGTCLVPFYDYRGGLEVMKSLMLPLDVFGDPRLDDTGYTRLRERLRYADGVLNAILKNKCNKVYRDGIFALWEETATLQRDVATLIDGCLLRWDHETAKVQEYKHRLMRNKLEKDAELHDHINFENRIAGRDKTGYASRENRADNPDCNKCIRTTSSMHWFGATEFEEPCARYHGKLRESELFRLSNDERLAHAFAKVCNEHRHKLGCDAPCYTKYAPKWVHNPNYYSQADLNRWKCHFKRTADTKEVCEIYDTCLKLVEWRIAMHGTYRPRIAAICNNSRLEKQKTDRRVEEMLGWGMVQASPRVGAAETV